MSSNNDSYNGRGGRKIAQLVKVGDPDDRGMNNVTVIPFSSFAIHFSSVSNLQHLSSFLHPPTPFSKKKTIGLRVRAPHNSTKT